MLKYYREIIPDAVALEKALRQPLPVTIWTNTLKITSAKLQKLMRAEGYLLEPLPWHSDAFRVVSDKRIGKAWCYSAGLFQVQEEVSMLPGVLLSPSPGEKVLDLCAAPGNKTAQLAIAMQNRGTLIANDRNFSRLRALGQIMKRLGLINISSTVYDGVTYPAIHNYFDKVLVDAPCSCEGTLRKSSNKVVHPSRARSLKMAAVQRGLLNKALQLCRPGGRILYSTCTFAPEENERVVSEFLRENRQIARIVPLKLEHFTFSSGCLHWQGEAYEAAVADTMRVWPDQNNSGGFYVALFEKVATGSTVAKPKSVGCDEQRLQDALPIIDQRFATQNLWSQYRLITDSKRGIYLTNKDNQPPAGVKLDAIGLLAIKTKIRYPKLSTAVAMCLGPQISCNKIPLSAAQRDAYYALKDIELSESQAALVTGTGYVLLTYEDCILGTGLFFSARAQNPPRVRSLFPKYLL